MAGKFRSWIALCIGFLLALFEIEATVYPGRDVSFVLNAGKLGSWKARCVGFVMSLLETVASQAKPSPATAEVYPVISPVL